MSAMEQSLRRALESGDTADPAFRESIYAASERALERMLAAKGMDADVAHAQRVRLAETINRVEEDYFAGSGEGAGMPAEAAWARDTDPSPQEIGRDDRHPEAVDASGPAALEEHDRETAIAEPRPADARPDAVDGGSAAGGAATIRQPGADQADETWSPGAAVVRKGAAKEKSAKGGRMRPFAFGLVVLGVALLAGIVFLYATVFAPMGDDAPAAEAMPQGSTVDEVIASATGEAEWITLFDGTQLEMISTPNGGEVSAITGPGDRPAVRIAAAAAAGEVDVSIGPGVVNGIKGQTVRVEITVGSADGTVREFGVRCLFGGDTVCGRQRFSTVQDSEAFVFDMVVPSDPAASGTIAIDPSFGAQSKNIDLYSVRLRPAADA